LMGFSAQMGRSALLVLSGPLGIIGLILCLLAGVIWTGDLEALRHVGAQFRYDYVLAAWLAYVLSTLGRTWRFVTLIANNASFISIFRVTTLYQTYRAALPSQIGEFSYPFLLKQATGLRPSLGLSHVLLVRLYDVNFVALTFLLGSAMKFTENAIGVGEIVLAAIVVVLSAAAAFQLSRVLEAFQWAVLAVGRKVRSSRLALLAKSLRAVRHGLLDQSSHVRAVLLGSTFWIILFALGNMYGLLAAFGVYLSVADALFVFGAVHILATIPLRLVAGVGIREAGLLALLLMLGYDIEQSAAVTVLFSVSALVFPAMLCLLVLTFTRAPARNRPS
jgi:hypothetical protein